MTDGSRRLRIAHLTEGLHESLGGPARAVPGLAAAQAARGHEVAVFGVRRSANDGLEERAGIEIRLVKPGAACMPSYSRRLLPEVVRWQPDIIHSHGIWSHVSLVAHRAAQRLGVPHVCSPHGALDPWALRHKRLKKGIGARLYQRRIVSAADCIQALVPEEREAVRRWVPTNPVVVVPNGVDTREIPVEKSRDALVGRYPDLRDYQIVLFLGRITAKKGVVQLVHAWRLLADTCPGWHLVIGGPEEGRYGQLVRKLVKDLDLEAAVSIIGPQFGAQIYDCLGAADVFVLPSYSEGLSMAVLEALACQVPVCVTPACHFGEVEELGCGVLCEPSPVSISRSLGALMAVDPQEREAMGRQGRALVESRFTWDGIAEEMEGIYCSVLEAATDRQVPAGERAAAGAGHYEGLGEARNLLIRP